MLTTPGGTPASISNSPSRRGVSGASSAGFKITVQPVASAGPIFHMWTTPSLQGVLQWFDHIACVHMSGLLVRSHMNAGQDGFRDKGSKQSSPDFSNYIGASGL